MAPAATGAEAEAVVAAVAAIERAALFPIERKRSQNAKKAIKDSFLRLFLNF